MRKMFNLAVIPAIVFNLMFIFLALTVVIPVVNFIYSWTTPSIFFYDGISDEYVNGVIFSLFIANVVFEKFYKPRFFFIPVVYIVFLVSVFTLLVEMWFDEVVILFFAALIMISHFGWLLWKRRQEKQKLSLANA